MFERAAATRDLPHLDFGDFHRRELPERLAEGNARVALPALRGLAPLCVEDAEGRCASYVPGERGVEIQLGQNPHCRLHLRLLDDAAWQDFASGLRTVAALLYTDAVVFERGDIEAWRDWNPAFQAMFHRRPPYDPAQLSFRGVEGGELDLHDYRFRMERDDPVHIGRYLKQTGYAVIEQLFEENSLEELREEVERVAELAIRGEARGWSAADPSGRRVCYRIHYTGDHSEPIRALYDDPRVLALSQLSGDPVLPARDRMDGIITILKRAGVSQGLANLPWHQDCGYGGHDLLCPAVVVGVQLDAANRYNGQLHFVAGSHRATLREPTLRTLPHLPVVPIETRAGDATVHIPDCFHAAPGTRGGGRPRRTLYPQFWAPRAFEVVSAQQSWYTDAMPGYEDGDVQSVEELSGQAPFRLD